MNILIFGPNGSGKGTQGALVKQKYPVAHIESGAIFREHIGGGTELGKQAKAYIDRGDLVPDDITIPMVLETLKTKGAGGWPDIVLGGPGFCFPVVRFNGKAYANHRQKEEQPGACSGR